MIVLILWIDMNYYLIMPKNTLLHCILVNGLNQIKFGCQSRAHVECSLDQDGNFIMKGGADAQIVQGLMAITAIAVNGLSPVHVSELSPEYANAMGIQSTLTPSRANGFLNMFKVQEEAIKLS